MAIPDGLRPNRIKTIIKSLELAVETRIWQAVLTREVKIQNKSRQKSFRKIFGRETKTN